LAARKLRMDRAEIRRRNLVRKTDLPYRTPMRLVFESGDFPGYMQRALEIADYAGFAERKRKARRPSGIGIANYLESPVAAGRQLLEKGRQAAAAKMEVAAADVVYQQGRFRVAGTDRAVALLDLTELAVEEDYNGRIPAHPGGCAICELEVDADTGTVEIVRYVSVDDVGQAVNPLSVDGQTHGGIAQGIGQALMEGVALDAANQVLTGSFMDYGFARAEDLPFFETALAEDPTTGNPLRIKGGGERG